MPNQERLFKKVSLSIFFDSTCYWTHLSLTRTFTCTSSPGMFFLILYFSIVHNYQFRSGQGVTSRVFQHHLSMPWLCGNCDHSPDFSVLNPHPLLSTSGFENCSVHPDILRDTHLGLAELGEIPWWMMYITQRLHALHIWPAAVCHGSSFPFV